MKTAKVTATITAIDKATRDVTIKGRQGKEVTLTAGPQVRQFDALKVGDQVNVEYVEALTLELKEGRHGCAANRECRCQRRQIW